MCGRSPPLIFLATLMDAVLNPTNRLPRSYFRQFRVLLATALLTVSGMAAAPSWPTAIAWAADAENSSANAAIDKRMADAEQYLASEKLEGRGPGTHGIDLAADYIADEFKKAGLKTDLYDGQPFQKFNITVGAKLGPAERNRIELIGPPDGAAKEPRKISLTLGADFTPLALGGSAKIDAPLVFAGYGITAKNEKYDDYAGIDVKDKAVIVLRHQPQRSNPHGMFGPHDSMYAPLSRKVSNAYEHGAAAIIFCTDDAEIEKTAAEAQKRWQAAIDELTKANDEYKKIEHPTLEQIAKHAKQLDELADRIKRYSADLRDGGDPVLKFDRSGDDGEGREFPVLHCRRSAIDQVVKAALGNDLATLEREIDAGRRLRRAANSPAGGSPARRTSMRQQTAVKNVLGMLEGEGPHAEETIIIGAHYDHLGYGGSNSLAPGVHAIHPARTTTPQATRR